MSASIAKQIVAKKSAHGGAAGKPPAAFGRREQFSKLASKTAQVMGHPGAFLAAVLAVVVWGMTGPLFGYSDTWQLVINTSTTIITFLMIFLVQNTQNRDAKALHLKLDELLWALEGARNDLIDAEDLSLEEIESLAAHYAGLRTEAQAAGPASTESTAGAKPKKRRPS
jgi:low affinity Fe/Cu permease